MANRFFDNYRPSHDGQSVVFGGGMIPTPKHRDVASYDFYADNIRSMGGKKGGKISIDTENPYQDTRNPHQDPRLIRKNGIWIDPDEEGPKPAGGSSVPRKPKPSKPSGGFSLPIPKKVGQ